MAKTFPPRDNHFLPTLRCHQMLQENPAFNTFNNSTHSRLHQQTTIAEWNTTEISPPPNNHHHHHHRKLSKLSPFHHNKIKTGSEHEQKKSPTDAALLLAFNHFIIIKIKIIIRIYYCFYLFATFSLHAFCSSPI